MQLFLSLAEKNPDFKSKVFAMEGDILEANLGLSEENLETLKKEVSLVFHSAATVRFDEPLR
jgi:fatty acyl-CoA reductase